jgi:S1-C subfamily serine protease
LSRRIDDKSGPLPPVGILLEIRAAQEHNNWMLVRSWIACLALALLAPVGALAQGDGDALRDAIVQVRTRILPDARSLATLGPTREGNGVLVREGYVATIGYLVIEAETIEVSTMDGKTVPATLAGYDHASGFGLLKLLAPIPGKPLPLGDSAALAERQRVAAAGTDGVAVVSVVSRRPFTGSWEYLLDSAIFTYPPVQNWSGAALLNVKGELLGLGSLIVGDATGTGAQAPGNMFVPVDLLKPILDDLIKSGRTGPGWESTPRKCADDCSSRAYRPRARPSARVSSRATSWWASARSR